MRACVCVCVCKTGKGEGSLSLRWSGLFPGNLKQITANLLSYLDFISPPVSFQRQVNSVYFDLSSEFDLVSDPVLLHKLHAHWLCEGYLNWIHIHLKNYLYSIRILDTFPYLSEFLWWDFPFNIFIDVICNVINNYRYLLPYDGYEIFSCYKFLWRLIFQAIWYLTFRNLASYI